MPGSPQHCRRRPGVPPAASAWRPATAGSVGAAARRVPPSPPPPGPVAVPAIPDGLGAAPAGR
eukprot:13429004-Alexandrium_andersonii.AAC.1